MRQKQNQYRTDAAASRIGSSARERMLIRLKTMTGFRIVLFIAILGLVATIACSEQESSTPTIFLISLDTLRGDYFTREHMPLVHDWASNNCRIYTNAHACSTWTKPSHVTMLTGLRAKEHGVEYRDGEIPTDVVMVQQELRQKGYKTYGFSGSGYVGSIYGFDRGFDHYWELEWLNKEIFDDHGQPLEQARSFLENIDSSDKPFFAFVQTYIVHQFWTDYVQSMEEVEGERPRTTFDRQVPPEKMRELYAAAVSECDELLMNFLKFVSERFPDAWIIITSDHGEGLGEVYDNRPITNHMGKPYPPRTDVPLIVYGMEPGTTDKLVGIDDIAGTIMEVAKIDENPQKSLFKERDLVISENIHNKRKSFVRTMAIIRQNKREMKSVVEESVSPPDTTKPIPEKVKKQMDALGYL